MKKTGLILISLLVFGLALQADAANVTFEPTAVKLRIAAGETGRTAITVHGFSIRAYSLNFLVGSRMENGNIPRGWMTSAYVWLDSTQEGPSSRVMNLVVTVPPDAAPGTYTGLLVPDDMRCSEPIDSPGVLVSIEVTGS